MKQYSVLYDLDDPRIITFLLSDERATIYHHPAWLKAISKTYNYLPFYLLLRDEESNSIVGLHPFVIKQNSIKKSLIVSLPSTTHCDPLFPENFNLNDVVRELNSHFKAYSSYVFRYKKGPHSEGFSNNSNYIVHIIELLPTLDETYNSFGKRSIRRFIKKADENNLQFRLGSSEIDLKIFYQLEIKLRKSIGLPPAPYKFFFNIWNELNKHNLIFLPIVEYQGKPIASSLVLKFRNIISIEYTGLDKNYLDLYPNHKLHWEIIKIAHASEGIKFVDMGRTAIDQKNLVYFKEKWNASPHKLLQLEFPPARKKSIKNGFAIKVLKIINENLPEKILELEGKLFFKFFE
jgi:hypothetical protein